MFYFYCSHSLFVRPASFDGARYRLNCNSLSLPGWFIGMKHMNPLTQNCRNHQKVLLGCFSSFFAAFCFCLSVFCFWPFSLSFLPLSPIVFFPFVVMLFCQFCIEILSTKTLFVNVNSGFNPYGELPLTWCCISAQTFQSATFNGIND